MKKIAFIESLADKVVVKVGGNEIAKFSSISDACDWAFSIGYRVYVKNTKYDKDCWLKYIPTNGGHKNIK